MILKSLLFAALLFAASCSTFLKHKARTHDDITTRETSWASDTGDVSQLNNNYLSCANGRAGAISQFQMERNDDLQVRYTYKCTPAQNIDWNTCTEESRVIADTSRKTTAELMAREAAHCRDYNVLTAFGLRTGDSGELKFSYTCCKAFLGHCSGDSTSTLQLSKGYLNLGSQNVAAPVDSVLTGFEFTTATQGSRITGSYRFNYCKNEQEVTSRETASSTHGDNDIIYLDRHNINCHSDRLGAISSFQLVRQGSSSINYKYQCTNANSIEWDSCVTKTNSWSNIASNREKSVHLLDNQIVQCDSGSVLTQFRFGTNGSPYSKMRYTYTCCPAVLDRCFSNPTPTKEVEELSDLSKLVAKAQTGALMTRFSYKTEENILSWLIRPKESRYEVRSCYAR